MRGTGFDAGGGRDGGCNDRRAIGGEGFGYAPPVAYSGEEGAGQVELVKAKKAMGKNDWVAWSFASIAEGSVRILYDRSKGFDTGVTRCIKDGRVLVKVSKRSPGPEGRMFEI